MLKTTTRSPSRPTLRALPGGSMSNTGFLGLWSRWSPVRVRSLTAPRHLCAALQPKRRRAQRATWPPAHRTPCGYCSLPLQIPV
jgi:hypothetical protein